MGKYFGFALGGIYRQAVSEVLFETAYRQDLGFVRSLVTVCAEKEPTTVLAIPIDLLRPTKEM